MKILLIIFSIFLATTVFGQNSTSQKLAAYMEGQKDINNFSGTVLIMRHDSILLQKAYGWADYELEVDNTVNTKFTLASITKHVTAIAIMQLVERGKLSVNDRLNKFIPDFPKGETISIHMLLTHTSGLTLDYEELYLESTSKTKDSALKYIKKLPLQFTPGKKLAYSNVGYFLLSEIVEKVSVVSFANYLQKNIFDVAGMNNSGLNSNEAIIKNLARIYFKGDNGLIKNPYINWNMNIGLDGMYATAEDLYKLNKALNSNLLLSEDSKKKMFTQYNKSFSNDGFLNSYGYGIFINPYFNHGHYMLTHNGGYFGVMTTMDRYPDDDVFITVLSNNESESHWIGYGLAGIVFGKDVEVPYKRTKFKIDPKLLFTYTGKYGEIEIIEKAGTLFIKSPETELIPETINKFYSAINQDRGYEFVAGKIKSPTLIITRGGVKDTLMRK